MPWNMMIWDPSRYAEVLNESRPFSKEEKDLFDRSAQASRRGSGGGVVDAPPAPTVARSSAVCLRVLP